MKNGNCNFLSKSDLLYKLAIVSYKRYPINSQFAEKKATIANLFCNIATLFLRIATLFVEFDFVTGNCDFVSGNSEYFSEFWLYNSQLWYYIFLWKRWHALDRKQMSENSADTHLKHTAIGHVTDCLRDWTLFYRIVIKTSSCEYFATLSELQLWLYFSELWHISQLQVYVFNCEKTFKIVR